MKIVLFTHYAQFKTASMPRFARMIRDGMQARGHQVEEWSVPVIFGNKLTGRAAKWLGYIDQYILFPQEVRHRLRKEPKDTLFVITDQALGMWVPLIRDRPHVIHCHDFLALRSALREIPQNPTGWTGRIYQRLIRRGFRQGRNFISVSHATQKDLHRFLTEPPARSEVIWNGLNHPYSPLDTTEICRRLGKYSDAAANGFVLHVGGNQWYKNRAGVLEIYAAYVRNARQPLPLWMVGAPPPEALKQHAEDIAPGQVHFLQEFTNDQLQAAYGAAKVLVFPSLAEGFGWPIVEAMACGTPVITTLADPMREIGGEEAKYLPRMPLPCESEKLVDWARQGAELLERTIEEGSFRRAALLAHAARFSTDRALGAYEEIYRELSHSRGHGL